MAMGKTNYNRRKVRRIWLLLLVHRVLWSTTVDEFVKQGCDVLVTGRNNKFREHYEALGVKYENLDLNSPEDFEKLPKSDVEGVILLAGLLPANAQVNLDKDENAAEYFRINTIGTINVLEYCRRNGIRTRLFQLLHMQMCEILGQRIEL